MTTVTRRVFLTSAITCSAALGAPLQSGQVQTFLAGLVPGGGGGPSRGVPPPTGGIPAGAPKAAGRSESYWKVCDECSRMGVHYIEVNNGHQQIMEAYESRISEYRDEMKKRGLTMLGFAVYSHMHDTSRRQELTDYYLRMARFLKENGGKYIAHLLAPGPNLGNGDDESYRSMDVKAAASNVNAVAKRVTEETGIRVCYHPEQGDIRGNIWERYLESCDEKYVGFVPDIGHFVACGLDPMQIYRKYRSRMVATHLRDFMPSTEPGGRGRMVPFGKGVIRLPALVGYLRDTKFTGAVMGEGGGNQAMRDYMAEPLKIMF